MSVEVWKGCNSDPRMCVVCGELSHTFMGFKKHGTVINLYACDKHYWYIAKLEHDQDIYDIIDDIEAAVDAAAYPELVRDSAKERGEI